MADRRTHRGAHPQDAELFAEDQLPALRAAVREFSWLLDRGYPREATLKLVGDRHALRARQRTAVSRSACSETERSSRELRRMSGAELRDRELWLDGFNVLTTVESLLGGGVLLIGRDGCVRDMASMHGSYRLLEDTREALEMIRQALEALQPARVIWYLDQPVSNSGRLKGVIAEIFEGSPLPLDIQLVPDPDPVLIEAPEDVVVVTADSGILDACGPWTDLVSPILKKKAAAGLVCDFHAA